MKKNFLILNRLFFILVTNIVVLISLFAKDNVGEINIFIKNIRISKGILRVVLYDSEKYFPDIYEKSVSKIETKMNNSEMKVVFSNILYGKYAISILQDENDNKKMDYFLFGMPKEGFGFSNNPKISTIKKPSFKDSIFELNTSTKELIINMQYLSK